MKTSNLTFLIYELLYEQVYNKLSSTNKSYFRAGMQVYHALDNSTVSLSYNRLKNKT